MKTPELSSKYHLNLSILVVTFSIINVKQLLTSLTGASIISEISTAKDTTEIPSSVPESSGKSWTVINETTIGTTLLLQMTQSMTQSNVDWRRYSTRCLKEGGFAMDGVPGERFLLV